MTTIQVLLHYFKDNSYIPILQPKNLQITINDEKYNLIINGSSLTSFFHDQRKLKNKSPKLIIFGFSVTNPTSYKGVFKEMAYNMPLIADLSNIPIILIGDHIKLRHDTEDMENQIITKMGEKLARRIRAVKYLEYSNCILNDIEMKGKTESSIWEEINWFSFSVQKRKIPRKSLPKMLSFKINVAGLDDSGKRDLIRRIVFGERLSVVGDCLHEETYFYEKDDETFSTFIEIDGEVHNLMVANKELRKCNAAKFQSGFWDDCDLTFFVLSVVRPRNFKLIYDKIKILTLSSIIVLVGYQTDLRNNSEILKKLSERNEQPITFEMGEQLARDLDAVKYLECSSSDDTEIQKVFEEAVWTLLRQKEQERSKKSKRNKGFFKRLFGR